MNRKELKQQAKLILKTQYGRILFMVFLYHIVTLDFFSLEADGATSSLYIDVSGMSFALELSAIVIALMCILVIFNLLYSIFVSPVFMYGYYNHIKYQALGNPNFDMMAGFHDNYKKIVKMNFIAGLEILIGTILLVVPGIIKALQYQYINEILEEHPDWEYQEVMTESKRITAGHKMELLILEISFFGWVLLASLLSSLTFSFAFYFVDPYIDLTKANAYLWLKSLDHENLYIQNQPLS